MKTSEVRRSFLNFFKSKGHTVVESNSLVPHGDPTLMFTNAGMNQFKDCFLGAEKRSYTRAASSQKVMRISGKHNDFENVGVTARHHTFFEMLGNFSFGDYFKAEAIQFAWEYLTEVLKLPKERLWITIHESDDEAEKLWLQVAKVDADRIIRLGDDDNFWAMGESGPCGPCSEIHYFLGDEKLPQTREWFLKGDGTFLEIWNLVFMQFNRTDGKLIPLPKPSVDTGMGLERISAVIQGKFSNYDCDILRVIIAEVEKLSHFKYDGSSYEQRDLMTDTQYARDVAMRVLADHSRAMTFIVSDGVLPSAEGRGYILRRVIRRAVRHGKVLEFKEPFLAKLCSKVVEVMSEAYPELLERKDTILRVVDAEERKFHETLELGLAILQKEVKKGASGGFFSGKTAFTLHDTYGFPLDLTEDALKPFKLKVDVPEFEQEMGKQRNRAREDRKSQGLSYQSVTFAGEKTKFVGYEKTTAEAKLTQIIRDGKDSTTAGLVFDITPFYAESGGQVGDSGSIVFDGVTVEVSDTQKVQNGYFVHQARAIKGEISDSLIGKTARLAVDEVRRRRIKAHHSATHLVHYALRKVLGSHIKQAGSRVDERSLRFDYNHFEAVTPQQLQEIQAIVNEEILANSPVVTKEMSLDEAKKTGAMALFGEKYGADVRVVQIGPNSIELCGGTHTKASGDLGALLVVSEGGIAAGVRRIECYSGIVALENIALERNERSQVLSLLKGDSANLVDRVTKLMSRNKELEKELERYKSKLASASSSDLSGSFRLSPGGIKVITEKVDVSDTDTLRSMVDSLKQSLGSGVVALGSSSGDSASVVVGVTGDLSGSLNAGALVKAAAQSGGGKGGGRADFAQAGGVDPAKLDLALQRVFEMVN